MKIFVALVVFSFLKFSVVASLRKLKPVTLSLNAGKDIPVRGFLIDISRSNWIKEGMDYQLIKIKVVSKNNSDSISSIKSRLTDLRKVINGLQKKKPDPKSDGLYTSYSIFKIMSIQIIKMHINIICSNN